MLQNTLMYIIDNMHSATIFNIDHYKKCFPNAKSAY